MKHLQDMSPEELDRLQTEILGFESFGFTGLSYPRLIASVKAYLEVNNLGYKRRPPTKSKNEIVQKFIEANEKQQNARSEMSDYFNPIITKMIDEGKFDEAEDFVMRELPDSIVKVLFLKTIHDKQDALGK